MKLSLTPDTHPGNDNGSHRDTDNATEAVLSQIRGVLQNLRFGSVTIIVQDGVVVQIDRTEKRRLQPSARRSEKLPIAGLAIQMPPQRNRSLTGVNTPREESQ